MAKNGKCKAGYYYCYTDKKCKPIPKGFKAVGPAGMLRKEPGHSEEEGETKKNGNGNGNGNGATNGGGNGNGGGGGMSEETKKDHEYSMARSELKTVMNAAKRLNKKMGKKGEGELPAWVQSKITKAADYIDTAADYVTNEETVNEEGLRDWFGKSKSKGGKPGWVQVVSGKPCARQPGQKSTPKCVSSAKRASMSKSERESAQRRKRAADPGQPQKTGAAKPTYVSTDKPKKTMKEEMKKSVKGIAKELDKAVEMHKSQAKRLRKAGVSEEFTTLPLHVEVPTNIKEFNLGLMFRESLDKNSGMLFVFEKVAQQSFHMKETKIPLDIAFIRADGIIESIKQLEPNVETPVASDGEILCAIEVNRGWFAENNVEVGDEIDIDLEEGKGEKDACYHKVKSRYSVWPSAYASGALVKCRKVGAANWGNKTKKEEFSNWRSEYKPTEYEFTDLITPDALQPTEGLGSKLLGEAGKKCWKGYKKAGTQKLFGKTYNRCVKAGDEVVHDGEQIAEKEGCLHTKKGKDCPIHGMDSCPEEVAEATTLPRKTGQIIRVFLTFRGKMYIIQMFFPSVVKPSRAEVQAQIEKVYPGGKVRNYDISDYEPGEPLLHTEDWQKKSGKNPEGGLNEKGRKSYERQNPGSDLKRPSKKVGNKRRASFCARMKGMKKKLTSAKTANDPDSRINKSLRAWNC